MPTADRERAAATLALRVLDDLAVSVNEILDLCTAAVLTDGEDATIRVRDVVARLGPPFRSPAYAQWKEVLDRATTDEG